MRGSRNLIFFFRETKGRWTVNPIGSFAGQVSAARHTKGHGGGVSACDLPSDRLSEKELEKMNGEVQTVKLRPGLSWAKFCGLSETLQAAYLEAMIEHGACIMDLAVMFGVNMPSVSIRAETLGVAFPKKTDHKLWTDWCMECLLKNKKEEELMAEKTYTVTTAVTKETPKSCIKSGSLILRGTGDEVASQLKRVLAEGTIYEVKVEFEVDDD